jgi:hypothetical protein
VCSHKREAEPIAARINGGGPGRGRTHHWVAASRAYNVVESVPTGDLMIAQQPSSARQLSSGFVAGVALTALTAAAAPALAQSPTPPPQMSQMLEWCRQTMGSIDVQTMTEACRQMMGQAAGMMQWMMSGMCVMGR